jgi:hypothetical protein
MRAERHPRALPFRRGRLSSDLRRRLIERAAYRPEVARLKPSVRESDLQAVAVADLRGVGGTIVGSDDGLLAAA